MADIIPPEDLVLRQCIAVVNTFLMRCPCLLIYEIRHKHIYLFPVFFQVPDEREYPLQCFFVDPVIAVHHFKIFPLSSAKTCIDGITVASVLFINNSDNIGIVFHIFMGNL